MFAQTWRVQWVNYNIYFLLPAVVWIIYILDRALDNQTSKGERSKVSSRHLFHHQHWKWLRLFTALLFGFCIAIVLQLPIAIFAHAIPVLGLVFIYYFLALFSGGTTKEPHIGKNLIAGLTFSYGVALGIFFFRPSSFWFDLLLKTPEMWFFAGLCACNITAIDIWEASRASAEKEIKGYYGFTLTVPLLILTFISLHYAINGDEYARPFYFAIMIAAGLLQIVNRFRSRFSLDALRVMADAALIVPAPIFWVYMQYLR